MSASQINEVIPEIEENKIPIEGQPSSVFRTNAGYVWGRLRIICLSLNLFKNQINQVAEEVNTSAVQVAQNKSYVSESRTIVENTMATMPDGSINDTTKSNTTTYSSNKIDEKINSLHTEHANNKTNPHNVTASQVGAYTKEETLSKDEIETKISNIVTFPIAHPMLSYEAYDFTVVAFGGEFNRADYPKLWTWVEAHSEFLLSEADWQTKNTTDDMCAYYSSGDGVNTFRVPNLDEAFFRASNRGVATYQADEFKSHTHNGMQMYGAYGNQGSSRFTGEAHTLTGATGGEETRPKNIALLPLIVAA
ncbi:hypothetical protein CRV02_00905 [Arcobacter sp. CECT 8989]|uniref:hypothetical protein n=1 Tax=Arcobacter sp. CECT 8989 TaxID=2044509 RepID=UPI00100AC0E6|nr:hypothetical protein [Arcobacter sp. CECT 8989]RXK03784.1 hypothetical protein CRV02_00905 [Arcobacter sp. CECT 8989]